jgi:general L-amino acid transport system permease protein
MTDNAQTVRYVRETMIPPSEPPLTEQGAVKWMRENLFSGWKNSLLSILSIYVLAKLLISMVPWFWNSVWTAGSLNECRETLAVLDGLNTHGGACFAVISDRWLQLLFGFYPAESYWRPILVFVLMFVALAPILFSARLPKQMLWFSILFPFIGTWLLWGGSFWLPVLVIIGFVVGAIGFAVGGRVAGTFGALTLGVLGAALWWMVAMPAANNALHKAVALSRIDATKAELVEALATNPEQIKAIEAEQATLQEQINAMTAEKDALVVEMLAAREAGSEPSSDQKAAFEAIMDELMAVRRQNTALGFSAFKLQQQVSDANGLLANIQALPQWEADLPKAIATAAELDAALPAGMHNLVSVNQVPAGTPAEVVDTLRAYLDADTAVLNLQANIETAYERLGVLGLTPVTSRDFGGFMLAMIIGVAGIVLSLPLGILLALARQANLPIVKGFAVAFIEIIRGVPLIVWLFTASLLLNYFLPPRTSFDLVLRVVIMVTLFAAAYIAEVIRGGLAALPKGQFEAADSLGLDYWKSMRLIVLPQALKISIPGIVNTFIGLFKDTTLVGIIGLLDPLNLSNSIRAAAEWNGVYWELFVFIGLLFFVSCFSMGRYSLWLEKKLQRGHR